MHCRVGLNMFYTNFISIFIFKSLSSSFLVAFLLLLPTNEDSLNCLCPACIGRHCFHTSCKKIIIKNRNILKQEMAIKTGGGGGGDPAPQSQHGGHREQI